MHDDPYPGLRTARPPRSRRRGGPGFRAALALGLALAAGAAPAGAVAQPCSPPTTRVGTDGWNSPRAVEIASSTIEARRHAFADSSLRGFRARAEGHVLFLADLGSLAGEQLVRADQVALDVTWQAPGHALQRIVGRRHLSRFPSRIHYHIDHLSLVLDNFRDRIEVGEGEEVRGVLHPAAEGALGFYEYRLTDSLGIVVLGRRTKVYRLEVRPLCPHAPAVVGTMDVDRDSRAIARLALTFTPAAYVDRTVDHVAVELASGHVARRFWLPYEQRVEIRRQVSWLDLPLGGIIRTRFRVREYDLAGGAPELRPGSRVTSLPDSVLALYAGWEDHRIAGTGVEARGDSVSLDEVRRRALDIVRGRRLGGSSRLRGWLPDLSSAVRGRRAEGLLLGGGARYALDGRSDVAGWVGYPLARERLEWMLLVRRAAGGWELRAEAYDDLPGDIGPFRAATGVVSSLGLAIRGEDFVDPFFRRGASLGVSRPAAGGHVSVSLAWEEETAARLVADPIGEVQPRPVRPIEEGEGLRGEAAFERPIGEALAARWRARVRLEAAAPGDFDYARLLVTLVAEPPAAGSPLEWEARGGAVLVGGSPPPQRLALLGGRGTIPGYRFRGWGGDRVAHLQVGVAVVALPPWIRLRAIGAAGFASVTGVGAEAAARLGVAGSDGLRASAGAGLGIAYDLIRVEAAHGLDADGRWEWMVSINPAFRFPF